MMQISPQDAYRLVEDNQATIIDVRSEDEFAKEHIPDALLMPYDCIDGNIIDNIDPEHILVLHCASGLRAQKAAQYLQGITNHKVMCLDGDIGGWKQAGFQTISN
jgi:rhodanese-related sulfurtransferase